MEEIEWTPDDLEKAIKILKDYLGKKVNEKIIPDDKTSDKSGEVAP